MDDLGSMICAMQYSSSSAQQNYVGGLGSTPLDQVEAILHANQWQFTRLSADELCMDLQGEHSDYAVFFLWDEALDPYKYVCRWMWMCALCQKRNFLNPS